ncbi:MAG: hypothetical protein E7076_05100 [Bacteroidales bacterium]|nr:hypothetical protein [Bacteroidales bacterium]
MNHELRITILAFLSLFCFYTTAQNLTETKINTFFASAQHAQNDNETAAINDSISQTLQTALKENGSFEYPFDHCPFLGKIYSSDHKLRFYTWNLPLSDGTFVYGGIVQKNDGTFVALKSSKTYKPTERQQVTVNNWYGALYYQVVAMKQKKTTCYILLGWMGNNDLTQIKVIDVLKISKSGRMTFGSPIFSNEKRQTLSRIVFEYSAQYKMTLKYNSKTKQIIFDHLAPSNPRMVGVFSEYGPDFSYDAYCLKKGKWTYKPDVDARNEE